MPRSTLRVLVVSPRPPGPLARRRGDRIVQSPQGAERDEGGGAPATWPAPAHPARRHGATALMSLRQGEREFIYHSDDYDHFLLSNRNTEELERDLVRLLHDSEARRRPFPPRSRARDWKLLYAVIRRTLPDAVLA